MLEGEGGKMSFNRMAIIYLLGYTVGYDLFVSLVEWYYG